MQTYRGPCNGGPRKGKILVHDRKIKEYFSPAMLGIWPNDNQAIIPIKIGEYCWVHNRWEWVLTQEGRAVANA